MTEKEKIFVVKDFHVKVNDKEVVKGINLELNKGEVYVIMGPNGSGKSTLANGLMGHPNYDTAGTVILDGEELPANPDERSKKGLFLSFQNPIEISGVTIASFLRAALNSRKKDKKEHISLLKFTKLLEEKMELLHIPKNFASRYVNEGFSGGEKKKMEILQMALLEPKVAILDETDSGLDIDALKKVCESINTLKTEKKDLTILIITHYQRMLNYINPDHVLILLDGKIVKKGGKELVDILEKDGYDVFRK
ncbi:MAG TPA: Fe-S cluster assembly ATPase SufC [Alphaproteobacteria bacterium]|nr:Fe-S cluster assembly ATPase SufC [Alphaproteobacteria bacterium]